MTNMDGRGLSSWHQIDYDIHGLIGIRLLNSSQADAAAICRQLGPFQRPLSLEPDIVLRFVHPPSSDCLRYVEENESGFTEGGFFVFQRERDKAKVRIAFDEIRKRCEILCEIGMRSVPSCLGPKL